MRKSFVLAALILPLVLLPAGPAPEAAAVDPCAGFFTLPMEGAIVELPANQSLFVRAFPDWENMPFDIAYYKLSTPNGGPDPIELIRPDYVLLSVPASQSPAGQFEHILEYAPFQFCTVTFQVRRNNVNEVIKVD